MATFDSPTHDSTLVPRGAAIFGRPSWVRAHIVLVTLLAGVGLVLFAIFAIHR